jgi:hypothetical protein
MWCAYSPLQDLRKPPRASAILRAMHCRYPAIEASSVVASA